jgi:hypothetical protein
MKTAAEIANHPKARLHRELVASLRDSGSICGAEKTWDRLRLNARFWKRIVTYGLASPERQSQLTKVAFPDCSNLADVDAALEAGNNLRSLHDLACGRSSLARSSSGLYKQGGKGLKIVRHATATSRNLETR